MTVTTPAEVSRPVRPITGPGGIRTLVAKPEPPATQAVPAMNLIEAVLVAAEGSAQQRLRTRAARVREQITELAALVKAESQAKQVEAHVQKLRDELAAAEAELRALRHPAGTPVPSTTSRDVSRAVRVWAQTNNIQVNAHGQVPNELAQRWQDATGGLL